AALATRPYLSAVYDEPEFIIRNLYRLYGGWWDGNPAHLKPPADADLARTLAELAGGARAAGRPPAGPGGPRPARRPRAPAAPAPRPTTRRSRRRARRCTPGAPAPSDR